MSRSTGPVATMARWATSRGRFLTLLGMLAACRFEPGAVPGSSDAVGSDAVGSDAVGSDAVGPDAVGSDAVGSMTIMFDAQSQAKITNASSLTWTHVVGPNLVNGLLVVGASIEKQSGATVQGITYAGVPLVKASSRVGGNGVRSELWYTTEPAAGSNDIVIAFTTAVGSDGAIGGAVSLSGVDQSSPLPTTATGGATSGSPSTSIQVANSGAWIIDVVTVDNNNSSTTNATQIRRWNLPQGISGSGSTLGATAPGLHTMGWTSTSDNWAQVVAEVKP